MAQKGSMDATTMTILILIIAVISIFIILGIVVSWSGKGGPLLDILFGWLR